MSTIITIANQKGGVGKTTTAVTLAHALALKGHNTLIIDLDPQGQSAIALGLPAESGIFNVLVAQRPIKEHTRQARENLWIIPGDDQTALVQIFMAFQGAPLDHLLNIVRPLLKNGLEYIIFDTSPSVGGLQERALYAADLVIIPTACDFLSGDAIANTYKTIAKNQRHGWTGSAYILPTFYDDTTNETRSTYQELLDIYAANVLQPIHRATILRECAAEGITIWEKNGNTRTGTEYAALLYKVMEAK